MTDAHRVAPDDILKLEHLMEARLSPDGRQVAYTVAAVDAATQADYVCLWLADIQTGETRRLTEPGDVITGPSWSPDGRSIAVRSMASGGSQVHVVSLDDGVSRQVTSAEWGVAAAGPFWSPDGKRLAYTARARPPRDPSRPYRVTRQLWRLDGTGLVDDVTHELFVSDSDGADTRQLTTDDGMILSVQWSPDGEELLYVAFVETDSPRAVVRACRVSTGEIRTLYEEENYGFWPTVAWLPDGRIVRSTSNLVSADMPAVQLVIDDGGSEPEVRSTGIDGWIYGLAVGDIPLLPFLMPRLVVSPDGQAGYVSVQHGGELHVWEVALTGPPACRPVVAGQQASVPYDARAGRLLVGTATMFEPVDLHVVDLPDGGLRRLTELNAGHLRTRDVVRVDPLRISGGDGQQIEGWFLRPTEADGPVPTVVNCHGGPHAAWGHVFAFDNYLLVAAGYAVLLVNQRGSTGYSREFATSLHGDWGHHDVGDILAGVDLIVDRGLADPDRLGIFGISAGAFLTAWITAHDHRFRAGIVESPLISWPAMVSGDVGHHYWRWVGGKGGLGVEAADPYVRFSPTTYAAVCRTPMLIIQHDHDLRTPPATSEEYYTLLRMHGCPAEMLRMPMTAHAGSMDLGSPMTRVAQNEAILDWMDRYVRG